MKVRAKRCAHPNFPWRGCVKYQRTGSLLVAADHIGGRAMHDQRDDQTLHAPLDNYLGKKNVSMRAFPLSFFFLIFELLRHEE